MRPDPGVQNSVVVLGYPFFRHYLVDFYFGESEDRSDRYIEFAPYKTEDDEDRSVEVNISYQEYVNLAAAHGSSPSYGGGAQ